MFSAVAKLQKDHYHNCILSQIIKVKGLCVHYESVPMETRTHFWPLLLHCYVRNKSDAFGGIFAQTEKTVSTSVCLTSSDVTPLACRWENDANIYEKDTIDVGLTSEWR